MNVGEAILNFNRFDLLFLLFLLLMAARVHLERQRTALDELYLAQEDAS